MATQEAYMSTYWPDLYWPITYLYWPAGWDSVDFVTDGTLEDSPAYILRQYLLSISLLQLPSGIAVWPCYIGSMPDSMGISHNSICVFDIPGEVDGKLMSGLAIEHYGVALHVRSSAYADGWEKIMAICDAMDDVSEVQIANGLNNYVVHNVSRVSSVGSAGMDKKRRYTFTVGFQITMRQLT